MNKSIKKYTTANAQHKTEYINSHKMFTTLMHLQHMSLSKHLKLKVLYVPKTTQPSTTFYVYFHVFVCMCILCMIS